MADKEKNPSNDSTEGEEESNKISRRQFFKNTGFAVGGAAVGGFVGSKIGEEQALKKVEVEIEKEVVKVKIPGQDKAIKEVAIPSIKLTVNGKLYDLKPGKDVNDQDTLLHTLRDVLKLTGTKPGCDHAECGMCAVHIDGEVALACSTLTVECDGKDITTIEGLADSETGVLHPVQQAFVDHYGFQCGICTPGMIMTAKGLLDENPNPTEVEAREALAGNICRCTGYVKIIESVMGAAELLAKTANLQFLSCAQPLSTAEQVVKWLSKAFNKNHSWLNAKWKFIPLPDSLAVIDKMPPDKKKYGFVFYMPVTDFLIARNGTGPEQHKYEKAYPDQMFAGNVSNGGWTFLTKNPMLAKDPKKLAGKVVGVVHAPDAKHWGSPTLLSNAILRDAWGILDQVKQIAVPFPKVGEMFKAKKFDAVFWGMADNRSGRFTVAGPLIGTLRASPTYWIPLTQKDVDKINAANEWKIGLITVPKNAIKLPGPPLRFANPQDNVTMADFAGAISVWKDTEDHIVYEMLKFIVDNSDRIEEAGLTMLSDPKDMAQWPGLTKDMVHPGALRFYKEYGIKV